MRTLRIAAAYCSVTCLAATGSSTTRGDQCPVGRHLDPLQSSTQGARAKNCRARGGLPAGRDQHIDHLSMPINHPVQIGPPAGGLDVGFVEEPPVTRSIDGLGGLPR